MADWIQLPSGKRINLDRAYQIEPLDHPSGQPHVDRLLVRYAIGLSEGADSYTLVEAYFDQDALALDALLERRGGKAVAPDPAKLADLERRKAEYAAREQAERQAERREYAGVPY
jgi:hypothetical protein